MSNKRMIEANRCLSCKNARCSIGCPISTPIPKIIELYKNNELEKAGEILFNNNPLSLICSIVCPHEDNCMGNCILNFKGEPVDFPSIEREISSKYLKSSKFKVEEKKDKRIAILGSGPAGITLAFILAQKGYKVTIFEKHSKLGGVLRYGIPDFRLPKTILDTIEDDLITLGVKLRYNDLIGPVNSVDNLLEDGYEAIFIGTGVWNPNPLRIKGETLGHVHYAINYLKSPASFRLGKKVAVIGAGNVAMDAARSAKRLGAEVDILYRRGREDIKATKAELKEAEEDDVNFIFYTAPYQIVDEGIIVTKTKNVIDEDHNSKLVTIEGSQELLKYDSIIIAVSQNPANNIVSNSKKSINTNKYGLVTIDDKGHTTRKGIFASGDVVTGAKTVVEAVYSTKIVAESIMEYLENK